MSISSAAELWQRSAGELAALVQVGDVSAAEVLEAHLDRIEEVNPRLNAVIVRRYALAREEAAAIDAARARGESLGPLAGVPMTVKECFELSGTPATMGLCRLADNISSTDSPLVARLKRAGAVFVGKTNVPQLMLMHETDNSLYGRTNHPEDPTRGPGGSSGGEAAIIAACGVPLGLGSDLGGSIRQPAHVCGIAGFKPTGRRLPTVGVLRSLHGMEAIPMQPGPMARNVSDLAIAMEVLTGVSHHERDAMLPAVAWPDWKRIDVALLRVAMWEDDGYFTPAPAIRRAVREAAAVLRDRGAVVEEFTPPDIAEMVELYFALLSSDGGANVRKLLRREQPDRRIARLMKLAGLSTAGRRFYSFFTARSGQQRLSRIVRVAGRRSAAGYWHLVERRNQYARRFFAKLNSGRYDAMLFPPHALPALTHGSTTHLSPAASHSFLSNLLDVPAGVVPVTRVDAGEESDRPASRDQTEMVARAVERGSAGLPVGVQVAALPWREDVVLAVMSALEADLRFR